MRGRLRARIAAAMMVFMVAGCASSYETTQPPALSDSQQPVIDSLSPAVQSGPNIGLVVVNETEQVDGNGYKQVIVNPGIVNTGNKIGLGPVVGLGPAGVTYGTLEVAEGRSYTDSGYGSGLWFEQIPVPPGLTVCGSEHGTFNSTFENVPATTHAQTFTLDHFPSIDLGAFKGSCANQSLGSLPTSFDATTVTPDDPGFSVSVAAVATATIPAGRIAAHNQETVSVTFVNKSQLDPLDFSSPGLWELTKEGLMVPMPADVLPGEPAWPGLWALTEKGFMLPIQAEVLPGDITCTIGPGQTKTCPLELDTTGDTGKPVALLVVSTSFDPATGVRSPTVWGMASL
jgi:hypothetical protein